MRYRPLLVLLLCAGVCAGLIGAVQLRSSIDAAAAASENAAFRSAPLPPVSAGPTGVEQIAVIGDEWASPRNSVMNRPWPYLLERSLGVRVRRYASEGGAYLPGAVGRGGAPYSSGASSISPMTTVIVFFGGARDAEDPPVQLAASATQAVAEAVRRAPSARVVVVAPIPARPGRGAQLTPARAVLKTVAQTARADFIDPVQERWMDSNSLWAVDGAAPSAEGNRRLAERMQSALAPLLTRANG